MSAFKTGEFVNSRFQLRKHLGDGSLGPVYLAKDSANNEEDLVLKIVDPKFSNRSGFINSFTMLAHSSQGVAGENFTPVNEIEYVKPYLVYTQNFIEGKTLRMWMMETLNFQKRITEGLHILSQILQATDTLHKAGQFACLKPENIYIQNDNNIIITDNWVAAFIPPSEYKDSKSARKYLAYLAPEIKKNWSNLTPSSDYFSLGVLLHEILIGKVPEANKELKLSNQSKFYNDMVDQILQKALHKNPEIRFHDLETWQDQLKNLADYFQSILGWNIELALDELDFEKYQEELISDNNQELNLAKIEKDNSAADYLKELEEHSKEEISEKKDDEGETAEIEKDELSEYQESLSEENGQNSEKEEEKKYQNKLVKESSENNKLENELILKADEIPIENLEQKKRRGFEDTPIPEYHKPIPPKPRKKRKAGRRIPLFVKAMVYSIATLIVCASMLLGIVISSSWK